MCEGGSVRWECVKAGVREAGEPEVEVRETRVRGSGGKTEVYETRVRGACG